MFHQATTQRSHQLSTASTVELPQLNENFRETLLVIKQLCRFFFFRKKTPTVVLSLQTLLDHKAALSPQSKADLKRHKQHTLKELIPEEGIYNNKKFPTLLKKSITDRKNNFHILEVLEISSAKTGITGKLVFNKQRQTSVLLCVHSSTRTGKILTGYEFHSNNFIWRLEWRVKDLRHAEGWKKEREKKHKNKRKLYKPKYFSIMNYI